MAALPALDDRTFRAFVTNAAPGQLVVVDFWADWCQPCKALGPQVAAFAADNPHVKVGAFEAGTEQAPSTRVPSEFGCLSLPVVLCFRDGQLVADLRQDPRRIMAGLRKLAQ